MTQKIDHTKAAVIAHVLQGLDLYRTHVWRTRGLREARTTDDDATRAARAALNQRMDTINTKMHHLGNLLLQCEVE